MNDPILDSVNSMEGVIEKRLIKHVDTRGHLIETFRIDELPENIRPAMSYVNYTQPGCSRAPHEHSNRIEIFAFPGPGNLRVILWDNRSTSPTYLMRKIIFGGEDSPLLLIIYPGIVHALENISKTKDALLINYPTTLFKGWDRKDKFIDEIKYDDEKSPFWNDFQLIRGKK